ncbi:hypothetical protein A2U01_0082647, partial [Trifolium medium]|nr:hypothetical protein [Trifolium medium]
RLAAIWLQPCAQGLPCEAV